MISSILKRCCGLDVHKKSIIATLLKEGNEGKISRKVKEFGTFKEDVMKMKQWLIKEKCEAVAMESTGIFWFPLYDLLHEELKVSVVNARNIKNVPGRKTDVLDSEWLAELLRCGLLKPSFIPSKQLRNMRLKIRYRVAILKQYQAEKNRVMKVLEAAGIKLSSVASDIFGVSGLLILKDLLEGSKNVLEIAQSRGKRLKADTLQIAKAIDGNLDNDKKFLLNEMIKHLQWLARKIMKLNDEILSDIEPFKKECQLIQTIPAINAISASSVIAEIGCNMEQFDSDSAHLSSWAGVCPGNNESAGKRKSSKVRKGSKHLRRVLCEIANAACKCKGTQFEYFYKSLLIRRGHKRAIMALAHKILRIIFSVLKNKKPYYEPDDNHEMLTTKRNSQRWIRNLKKYGYLAPKEDKPSN
ncbi:MAG: IS110 family transposase [Nitrospirota bacterium]